MIKANIAYEMMEKALDLIPSHESTSTYLSAYGVFNLENGNCVAVRAANHGTFLYNWLKMQDTPFNVDLLTSANIAITFLDGSIPFSQNNNINMDSDAEPPVFVVRQYVYNCAVLDSNDINTIISASKKLISDGVYTDPFEEDGTKHAIIYREKTNEPSKDVTAKTLKRHRAAKKKGEEQSTNNTRNNNPIKENRNMKQTIRLTESELRNMIAESVKGVINELDWKTQQWAADERQRRNDDVMKNGRNSQYFDKYQQQGLANGSNYGNWATLQGKAYQQQRNNQQGAKQQFNRDYGFNQQSSNLNGDYNNVNIGLNYNGDGVTGTQPSGNYMNGSNAHLTKRTSYNQNGNGPSASLYNDASYQTGYNMPTHQGSTMVTAYRNGVTTSTDGNQSVSSAGNQLFNQNYGNQFKKADDEVRAYRGGGYQYQKGKGWQMNESINRKIDKIVSECIRKRIR